MGQLISTTLIERPVTGERTVPTYRPLRPGDLLAVRSNDPYLDEIQVVIDRIVDNGATLLIAGDWRGRDLEVLIRRVGGTHPQPLEQ